jgi:hypothetical protein
MAPPLQREAFRCFAPPLAHAFLSLQAGKAVPMILLAADYKRTAAACASLLTELHALASLQDVVVDHIRPKRTQQRHAIGAGAVLLRAGCAARSARGGEIPFSTPSRLLCIIPCIRHNNPLQVQAELLGEGTPGTLSPALEDGHDAAAVAPAPAPKPFKPFSSPLRPLTAKYSSGADENSATESGRGEGGAGDFDSADDPQEEILQLQVRLLMQACAAIRSKFA